MAMPAKDLTGQRFGRWLVKFRDGYVGKCVAWRVVCACGTEDVVSGASLRSGSSKSCGCFKRDWMSELGSRQTRHNHTSIKIHGRKKQSGTYNSWLGMKQRCFNPDHPSYKNYGGRGISICERWASFDNFLADMGKRPPGMSIDRIDNDKDYGPDNCQWSSRAMQTRNRRVTKLSDDDVRAIKMAYSSGEKQTSIAQRYGVHSSHVSRICTGVKWREDTRRAKEPAKHDPRNLA